MSRECPRSVRDTFLTLRGHSRDTFWTLRSPAPEGPQRHPEGHSRDTSAAKGPRDSCSRSRGCNVCDQAACLFHPWPSPGPAAEAGGGGTFTTWIDMSIFSAAETHFGLVAPMPHHAVQFGNGWNTVSRALFRKRELTEFCAKFRV